MAKLRIEGSFVASITPFNEDGSIDFGAFRTLIDFQARHGTAAMLFMGSTGEPSLLSPEEKKRIVVETVKLKPAGMHFFYGCTGNTTEQVIDNVRFAAASGADGAIIAAPPYICAPEEDIERFYLDVADATELPLGVYNNPPRIKTDLHWDQLLRIYKHPHYVILKESTTAWARSRSCSQRSPTARSCAATRPTSAWSCRRCRSAATEQPTWAAT